jgi:hypothetical protein
VPGLKELQDECKALGIPGSLIRRNMNDAGKLEELIESFQKGKAHVKEVKRMAKPVARAKANKRPRPKPITLKKQETVKPTTAAKRKPVSRKPKRQAAVTRKPTSTRKPQRQATKPTTRKRTSNNDAGRFEVGSLNFGKTTNWNPREGSIVSDIFAALKECKGDVNRTYNLLLKWAPIREWIPRVKPNGVRRTDKEMQDMLRYRINRTRWDFANATGQHTKSENRAEYGSLTNGKAKPMRKPAATTRRKPGRPKKAETAKPARRTKPKPQTRARTTRSTTRQSRRPARARR